MIFYLALGLIPLLMFCYSIRLLAQVYTIYKEQQEAEERAAHNRYWEQEARYLELEKAIQEATRYGNMTIQQSTDQKETNV